MPQAPTTKESHAPHAEPSEQRENPQQMCCDGKRTAAEHRAESADGTCCSDS